MEERRPKVLLDRGGIWGGLRRGITTTFGFRMPHEGPFKHYDLAGIWKWPEDVRNPSAIENEKLRERMSQATPWFVDPERFDEAVEQRDREYIRRLKALYWPKGLL